ncbi:MAG: hypothetical protein ACKORB_03720 [Opitutia bacterium]
MKARFVRIGLGYGLAWGLVALTVMKLCLNAGLRELLQVAPVHLLGGALTGLLVTFILSGPLQRARNWAVIPWGLLALLLGTLAFAAVMLVINAGYEWVQALSYRGPLEALQSVHLHDSLIMFFWYPLYGFGTVVPILLAVLNCWDLRRRMIQASAQPCHQS